MLFPSDCRPKLMLNLDCMMAPRKGWQGKPFFHVVRCYEGWEGVVGMSVFSSFLLTHFLGLLFQLKI